MSLSSEDEDEEDEDEDPEEQEEDEDEELEPEREEDEEEEEDRDEELDEELEEEAPESESEPDLLRASLRLLLLLSFFCFLPSAPGVSGLVRAASIWISGPPPTVTGVLTGSHLSGSPSTSASSLGTSSRGVVLASGEGVAWLSTGDEA